jgi:hypothetical protein
VATARARRLRQPTNRSAGQHGEIVDHDVRIAVESNQFYSTVTPDPSAPQIIDGQKLIARFLGAPEDACQMI